MSKYICRACGYVFSDENNEPDYEKIDEMIPEDYECPCCGKNECELVKEQS
jgi:rubredoxin